MPVSFCYSARVSQLFLGRAKFALTVFVAEDKILVVIAVDGVHRALLGLLSTSNRGLYRSEEPISSMVLCADLDVRPDPAKVTPPAFATIWPRASAERPCSCHEALPAVPAAVLAEAIEQAKTAMVPKVAIRTTRTDHTPTGSSNWVDLQRSSLRTRQWRRFSLLRLHRRSAPVHISVASELHQCSSTRHFNRFKAHPCQAHKPGTTVYN